MPSIVVANKNFCCFLCFHFGDKKLVLGPIIILVVRSKFSFWGLFLYSSFSKESEKGATLSSVYSGKLPQKINFQKLQNWWI